MGTLLNRRRYMGGGSSLPYDAEVEYLQSSGTQYINTGYYPNSNTVLNAVYISQKTKVPFSARWTGASTYDTFGVYIKNDTTQTFYFGRFSSNKYKEVSISSAVVATISIGLTQLTINGTSYSISRDSINSTYPIYLFCMNNVGSVDFAGTTKIYSFKIIENNTTVLDMIPVRVGQVGYLYDKVSGQLFGNAGTGDFILGPDKT